MKREYLLIFVVVVSMGFRNSLLAQISNTEERNQLARKMENSVETQLLNKWYPQSADTLYGGFLSTFTYDFRPTGPQDKFIVTQARHTWTTARAAHLYPHVPYYLQCARGGFQFLRDIMWDKTYGGFYDLVDRKGLVLPNLNARKEAYGNAFAIYGLSAYYEASGDTAALNLAKKAFLWLEDHSHDPIDGGYFQYLERDGKPIQRDQGVPDRSDIGYKDQNSSIHLLEAFTALYKIWPEPLVRLRLQEMLQLIRDKIVTNKGYLRLYFKPDWTPISFRDSSRDYILAHKYLDHVSFGHDIETTYLMLEASHTLGWKNDTLTLLVGKKMLDHALQAGWDKQLGGFYDEGYYFKGEDTITILLASKNWWAQAEGLNTLLLMADRFPADTMHYIDKFIRQWKYIETYLIDPVNGDWYEEGLDGEPQFKTALKGHIWKGAYHNFRALANCVKRLQSGGEE